jgi:integrase
MGKLTNPRLRALLKKPGRHSDGGGLYFRTLGDDKAYWVYRYRIGGKEREISIGPYPEKSLQEVRDAHVALRDRVITDKADPLADKRAGRMPGAAKPSFGEIADDYIAAKGGQWKNAVHRAQWATTLTKYAEPLRGMSVDQIGTEDVLKVLKPLWTKTPETASRLRGRIEAVLNAARALGHIDQDRANPARWKGHLDHLLANPKPVGGPRGHHAAMPYADVPSFMATLHAASGESAKALAFLILISGRLDEVRGAVWAEIDLDAAVWTVPAERMKGGRLHRVPLSEPAMAILRGQLASRQEGQQYVFPGAYPQQPLSPSALAMTMRRLGMSRFTTHGFRSSFRDWAGDKTDFPREVAEALAHAVGDETERAYRRGDALDKRRQLMDAWADFLAGADSNVIPIARRAAS